MKPQQKVVTMAASRFSNAYGGLNESVSHRFRCLNTWSPVVGAIYKGPGDVALLEEVCHWRQALRFQKLKPGPVSLSLPAVCRSRCRTLSYSPASCLPVCHYACCRDNEHLSVWSHNKMLAFINIAMMMVSLPSHRSLTSTKVWYSDCDFPSISASTVFALSLVIWNWQ